MNFPWHLLHNSFIDKKNQKKTSQTLANVFLFVSPMIFKKSFSPFVFYDGKAVTVSAATQINGVKKSDAGLFFFFSPLVTELCSHPNHPEGLLD